MAAFKTDVIVDSEDEDVTRFHLNSEDAVAWAEDQDVSPINNVIEVPHAQAAEMIDRMKEDGLTFS